MMFMIFAINGDGADTFSSPFQNFWIRRCLHKL